MHTHININDFRLCSCAHEPCAHRRTLTHATVKKKEPAVLASSEISNPLFTNKRKTGFISTTVSRHQVDAASHVSLLKGKSGA